MKKILVIIGASSDLAVEYLRRFCSEYDRVICHYRTPNDDLEEVIKIKTKGGSTNFLKLQCDLVEENDVEKLCAFLDEIDYSGTEIHYLHFPAMKSKNVKFHKTDYEYFENEINIGVRSFIKVSQVLIPKMIKNKSGKIVAILSYVVDGMPPKYISNYVMVKYALLGLVKSLAVEYANKGITVNGVSPATIDTKFMSEQPEILMEQWRKQSPTGQNLSVGDVIPTIHFLTSKGADNINGANIIISHGMGMH